MSLEHVPQDTLGINRYPGTRGNARLRCRDETAVKRTATFRRLPMDDPVRGDGAVSVGWRCGVTEFLAGRLGAISGRVAQQTVENTDSRLAARLAALASLGASVIHFAVVPAHWQEWKPAGVFFLSAALFQLMWSRIVLVRTSVGVLAAGILLNVAAIALWALSRTAGAPVGPHAGQVELIAAADLCALLLQIYVVMGAGWVWYRGLRGGSVPAFANAAILLVAVGVVTLASVVGAASGLRHGDHGHGGHGHGGDAAEVRAAVPAPVGSPPGAARQPVSEPLPAPQPLAGHEDHDHAH